ncbi:MAG TPA: 3-deoxy-manno-octulosonate cytidylyltransferase [Candidatus Omnitrophota bacterium]|nr:3-deoxy-manno-octulosonate cytidylyltransferase [Candidatus Omnitrophota bacterium]
MKKIVGVIPARLESVRLPRKMLRAVGGKPLVQWTYENACKSKTLDEVIVACDSKEVEAAVKAFGGKVRMTRADHPSGTSRISEIAEDTEAGIWINIQGDEPLLDVGVIDSLAGAFADPDVEMATAAVKKTDEEEFRNPNVVKLVKDGRGFALFFSRASVPYSRDGLFRGFWKHLGIYAYRRDFLTKTWKNLKPSALEETEKLEQLRVLENGHRIKVVEGRKDSVGIDTEEDLREFEKIISRSA